MLMVVAVVGLVGCTTPATVGDAGGSAMGGGAGGGGAPPVDAGSDAGEVVDSGVDAGLLGLEFLSKLQGLWSGPATMTRLGDFPVMAFDLRAVDGQFVFGQADLDSANTLRFGFSVETYEGEDVVAFRNGGYFQGVLRDTRTRLVASDGGTYQFCFVGPAGCGYLDARFTFGDARLVMDTTVRGQPHLHWEAQRQEPRDAGVAFPLEVVSRGDGGAPWPELASVRVDVTFGANTAAPADVWMILTTTNCFPTFACRPSRAVRVSVPAGSGMATLTLPNVHAGEYKVAVVVDLDRNFASVRAPTSGDRLAVDQPLVVGTSGEATLSTTTLFTAP